MDPDSKCVWLTEVIDDVSTKRTAIVILAGLNLFLLAALIMGTYPPSAAYAQPGARAGDFACVTAKTASQSYDVLYVLDIPARKLYGFYPSGPGRGRLVASPPRDLNADFQRTQPPGP